ncbi:MAG: hypothetical protein IPF81_18160 [Bacteroidetes bacterium]|nr:hypothetical protein [Bacteroidota bacterium]
MNGWSNNVTDKDFDAKNRHLSYFPDFQSEDIHRFMIQFDQPVQLLETAALQDTIKINLDTVSVMVKKIRRNILIESTLVIHAEKYLQRMQPMFKPFTMRSGIGILKNTK